MAKFSPADAVFSGFRFVKARPATILVWAAYMLAALAVSSVAMIGIGGDSLAALSLIARAAQPNPQQLIKLMQDVLPATLFGGLLMTVFGSVLSTAMLRERLKPGPHPWAGLRLGTEELRMLGAKLLVLALLFAAEILVGIFASALQGVGIPSAAILGLGLLLMAALMVRLSLAGVVSQTEASVNPLRSLRLTGKLFWPLLGAIVLLGAIMLVVLVLVNLIFTALIGAAALAGGVNVDQTMMAMVQGRFADLNPLVFAVYILSSLIRVWIAVAATAVFLSVASDAYKAATSDEGAKTT